MRAIRPTSVAAIALVSFLPSHASALAQRTFVSAIGTDNPNCSIAAPCRSFTAAMNATSPGGEIIVLESGGYGPVTITKSVSIVAPPGVYGGISVASGLNGVTINAPGATVVLRGLSINGQGGSNGIFVQQAARVRVENCVVSNMSGNGIYDHADNAEMIVSDTISRDNADGGLAFVASNASMLLHHVHSEHNQAVGFYVAPSIVGGNVRVDIVDSVFAYNGAQGIWADSIGGTETIVDVERSVVSKNGGDGFYASAAASNAGVRVTLRNDVFGGNGTWGFHVLATFGFALATIIDNSFTENYSSTGDGAALVDGNAVFSVSRNAGQGFGCQHFGTIQTYQNNSIPAFAGCTVFKPSTN